MKSDRHKIIILCRSDFIQTGFFHASFFPAYTFSNIFKNYGVLMKKRILSLCLAASTILLVGCSSSPDSVPTNSNSSKKELTRLTLNEVAHSIFYAPMYVAMEKGYFLQEGIDLRLHTGFGADKTMTAVLSGEADIGFMGSEASIYTYNEGASDFVVNFAQLTQRAGNFLVAREEMPDFKWTDLKGSTVLGGRKGGVHISM